MNIVKLEDVYDEDSPEEMSGDELRARYGFEKFPNPSGLEYRGDPVYVNSCFFFILRGNKIYVIMEDVIDDMEIAVDAPEAASAVVATWVADKNLLILNGDASDLGDVNGLIESCGQFLFIKNRKYKAATTSFACIGRLLFSDTEDFFDEKNINKVIDWIPKSILDYTQDKYKKSQKDDEKLPLGRSRGGATLIYSDFILNKNSRVWHSPSTLLLKHKGKRYLIGQDEETFFGCELKGKPNTVKEAYEDLKPDIVKKKKKYKRQGEWFVYTVSKHEVPSVDNCAALFGKEYNTGGGITLPLDDPNSNCHIVFADDGRISKKGDIYAFEPRIEHPEHDILTMPRGWYTFVKNTAIRNISQEGVD